MTPCRQTLEANRREIEILHDSMRADAGRSSRRHLDDCRDALEQAVGFLSREINALADEESSLALKEQIADQRWARSRSL